MSLKLNRKGTVAYINNHPALMGRDLVDQHPIKAIEGLIEALDEKYVKPATGIPIEHMGYDAATKHDIDVVKGFLQVQIDSANSGIQLNADQITAIQDFLSSIFGDGSNGMPNTPIVGFAYREGFRDEFIGVPGDTVFTLSDKYVTDGQHLKVFRDGELLLVGEDYNEINCYEIEMIEPLEETVFITCACDSTSTVVSPVHEEVISVADQTTFLLRNTYRIGDNSLSIFVNGLRLEKGVHYEEINMETIELSNPYPEGTKLIFRQELMTFKGDVLYNDHFFTQKSFVHKVVATEGQRIIELPEAYVPGACQLMVTAQGLVQGLGEILDYIELDERRIQFNYDLEENEIIVITSTVDMYNWTETFISLRNQKRFILTHPYLAGKNDILVYEAGILLQAGEDYIETNDRTIDFVEPAYEGSAVIIFKRR